MPKTPLIDPYAGMGGSYEMQPDGSRKLLERTAVGDAFAAELDQATSDGPKVDPNTSPAT